MSKIVCFGEALIDMLAQPWHAADAPFAFVPYAGGAPANVAVAAARLGADAQFVGMLGQDMFGDFLLERLMAAGVSTSGIVRTGKANTALAFVALDADGERSFSFYRPPSADLLFTRADFHPGCFDDIGSFHVCSNSLTEAAIAQTTFEGMARARAAGAVVSVDLNLRPALWRAGEDPAPRLWQALDCADLVKLARDELESLAQPLGGGVEGEALVRQRIFSGAARCLIITNGAAVIEWFTREDSGQVEPFEVDVRDTTAAGDAFVGGLLFRLGQLGADGAGFDAFCRERAMIDDAIRFGAAVGALTVTRNGSFAAMPTLDEVQHVLQEKCEHAL